MIPQLQLHKVAILEVGSSYTIDAKASIFSNDDIEIKGSSRLDVVGNYKHGICSDDDLVIENGKVVITDGLHANDTIQVLSYVVKQV